MDQSHSLAPAHFLPFCPGNVQDARLGGEELFLPHHPAVCLQAVIGSIGVGEGSGEGIGKAVPGVDAQIGGQHHRQKDDDQRDQTVALFHVTGSLSLLRMGVGMGRELLQLAGLAEGDGPIVEMACL